jgi:hypothetical protein
MKLIWEMSMKALSWVFLESIVPLLPVIQASIYL